MRSYDELVMRLQELRAWAGMSYRELHRRVVRLRRARGVTELPVYNTVYRCLQPGRSRLDIELVADIAAVLLGDSSLTQPWRQACQLIERRACEAAIVTVADGLPDDLDVFTGRGVEIAQLLAAANREPGGATVAISAIEGMAGVGKTRFAVRVAHELEANGRFPDVRLSVNLRGYDPNLPPADPAAVLEGFLRRLGVAGSRVATMDLAHRSAALREQLTGKRAIILLDNAESVDQVRPLLPETSTCLVLVTSRRRLDGLPATHLTLDVFTPDESLELLRRSAGADRIDAEPDSAAAIADLVGHLPLAVSLVAAHIRACPDWRLADHLERLTERRARLRLDDGVRIAIGSSYDDLGAEHRRLLRLSALHPGRDFDAYAAAALTGADLDPTQVRLAELAAANLLRQRQPGRFELHDLVRLFAADRACDEEPASARRAALDRMFAHYRYLALTAMNLHAPQEAYRQPPVPDPGTPRPALPDRATAVRWLDTERPNLLATASFAHAHGWPEHVGQLSLILFRYLDLAGHYRDAEILHTLASRTGDRRVVGRALTNLGIVYLALGRHRPARDHFTRAIAVSHERGDHRTAYQALLNLGATELYVGRLEESRRQFQRAVDNFYAAGDKVALGKALGNLGVANYLLGRYPEALDACQQALAIARQSGDRVIEALCITHVGSVYERLGRYPDALEHLHQGLEIAREVGHRLGEADALNQLGVVYARLTRYQQAMAHHEKALAIARDDGIREIEVQILNGMSSALRGLGHHERAADSHRRALAIARRLGDRYEQARAHAGLGTCRSLAGNTNAARVHWQDALALHTELGTPEAAELAARLREHATSS